jgi:hypothetical protein
LPSFDTFLYCCCAVSASSSPVFLVFFFLERFKDPAAMGGVSKASVEATLTTKLQPVHLVILRVLFSSPFITGFVFLL